MKSFVTGKINELSFWDFVRNYLNLDLSIRHLGKGEVNWDGRKTKNDL